MDTGDSRVFTLGLDIKFTCEYDRELFIGEWFFFIYIHA